MIRAVLLIMALGAIALPSPAVAQDAEAFDAAAELQSLQAELSTALQAFMEKYNAAETNEAKAALLAESYPNPKFAPRFLELAEKYPGTAEALTALAFALQNAQDPKVNETALEAIRRDHLKSADMVTVVSGWMYDVSKRDLLQEVLDNNPHREVKGVALYALAKQAMMYGDEERDAKKLFEQLEKEYADVPMRGTTLGGLAKSDMFEATHLQIGMEAPDIAGEDIDGVEFKLSDYRGKVVVIDFWGDW